MIKNLTEIRERFLKEETPMRLGHLASDLSRVASLLEMQVKGGTIKGVLEEAKFFAEWAAKEAPLETQIFLAEIQGFLARNEISWEASLGDAYWRKDVATQSRTWAEELLNKAGFVR